MCTVSYIVTENGYTLTSNRDESPERETLPPELWNPSKDVVFEAPRDKEKNGTWIAVDREGRSACVLNGAFEKHTRKPPYRISRGALIPMAFKADSFFDFWRTADFNGMEPFTLILIDDLLQVVKWDGDSASLQFLSKSRPQLWSSATLYSSEEHRQKEIQFFDYLKEEQSRDPENILDLHGATEVNDFILDRPEVRTVSITQIRVSAEEASMEYLQPALTART